MKMRKIWRLQSLFYGTRTLLVALLLVIIACNETKTAIDVGPGDSSIDGDGDGGQMLPPLVCAFGLTNIRLDTPDKVLPEIVGQKNIELKLMNLAQQKRAFMRAPRSIPLIDEARAMIKVDDVQGFSLNGALPAYSGHTGKGIRVAVRDTGIDPGHEDFLLYDEAGKPNGTRISGDGPNDMAPDKWHGTRVAGVVGGSGHASLGYEVQDKPGTAFQWRGIAPEVTLSSSLLGARDVYWVTEFVDQDAHVSNHSHTSAPFYADVSAGWDQIIRFGASDGTTTRPPRPVVFAAGNNQTQRLAPQDPLRGFYSLRVANKNAILVGATNSNDDGLGRNSSLGPTLDGRIKPDLVAPGYADWLPPEGIGATVANINFYGKGGAPDHNFDAKVTHPDLAAEGVLSGAIPESDGVRVVSFGAEADRYVFAPAGGFAADDISSFDISIRFDTIDTYPSHVPPRMMVVDITRADDKVFQLFETFDFSQDVNFRTRSVQLDTHGFWTGDIKSVAFRPFVYPDFGVLCPGGGDAGYSLAGGTSTASPMVAGAVALLLESFRDDLGYEIENAPPRPSTLKALLIHSAQDLSLDRAPAREVANPDTGEGEIYGKGPDFVTGYGLLDVKAAMALALGSAGDEQLFYQETLGAAEIHSYRIPVQGGMPLRVSITWDDLPYTPDTAYLKSKLVNDLDIVLVSPGGKAHSPWVLKPLPVDPNTVFDTASDDPIKTSDLLPATQCVNDGDMWGPTECQDHLNNVEQVLVEAPEDGFWTIYVRGHRVTDSQPYSLVASQACQ